MAGRIERRVRELPDASAASAGSPRRSRRHDRLNRRADRSTGIANQDMAPVAALNGSRKQGRQGKGGIRATLRELSHPLQVQREGLDGW